MNLEYRINATFSLLNWLFFHTIYGMLGVATLICLLFRDLRKTYPRFPEPALVAGLVFLVGVGTLPSIPRYQFHNEMLKLMLRIEDRDRVARTSRWRSMTEPLTWVSPPIGGGDAHLAPISQGARRPTDQPRPFREPFLRVDLAVRGGAGRIARGRRLRPVHHQVYTTERVGDPPPRDAFACEDGRPGKGLVL